MLLLANTLMLVFLCTFQYSQWCTLFSCGFPRNIQACSTQQLLLVAKTLKHPQERCQETSSMWKKCLSMLLVKHGTSQLNPRSAVPTIAASKLSRVEPYQRVYGSFLPCSLKQCLVSCLFPHQYTRFGMQGFRSKNRTLNAITEGMPGSNFTLESLLMLLDENTCLDAFNVKDVTSYNLFIFKLIVIF